MIIPPLDFKVGCSCAACELAVLLWYTEDEHPARAAWEVFWRQIEKREVWPCAWQLRRCRDVAVTGKPVAYKICSRNDLRS